MRRNIKEQLENWLEYALMLVIFLFGQSVYIRMIDNTSRYIFFDVVAILILLALVIIDNHLKKKSIVKALLLVGYVVIYYFFSSIFIFIFSFFP